MHVEVSGKPIIVDHMPVTITNFSRATSQTMVARIGFVPGLSSTEDDYSATRSLSDHNSAIHPPSLLRSQSYAGSSVAPATDPRDLRRQDSVISQGTQFSGPGMAGRGVPGQIFSWGAYGAAQAYDVQTAPRPAFAGPPSIFEGRELAPEENRALFHHSLRPQNAQMLGTDGGPLLASNTLNNPRNVNSIAEREEATSTGHGSPDAESLPRQRTVSSPAQPNGAGANLQHSMSVLSNDSAEAEKIRLYERARQQAERNQRRADEKRARTAAATAAGLSSDATSTILSSAPDSRASTPRIVPDGFGGFRARTPANNQRAVSVPLSSTAPERHSSIMAFNTAEEEKQRLYERARAEAEKYQSGYAQGASFPPPPDGGSNAAPESGTSSELGPPNADSFAEDRRRSSANYWIGAQGSSDAAGGISASQSDPTALASTAVGTSSRASVAYPTAEEEKRRLYEQAKAEADAYQRGEPSSSSSAAAGTRRQSMVAGYVSAEEEKRRLYEQAKAEADAYQRGEEPASRRPEYGHAAQPSFTSTQHATSSSPAQVPGAWAESSQNASASQLSTSSRPTPEDEKAQMRRFYEAQDAVLRSQGGGQSSTAGIAAGYHGGATREAYPSAPVPSYHQAVSSTASLPEMVAAAAVIPGGSPQSGEAHYLSASQAYNSVSTYTSPNMYRHSLGFNAHGPSLAESSGRNISSSHVPMESSIGADSGPRRAPSTSPSLLTNAEREKEQIRLYYAALDAQTEPNGGATGSGSGSGSGVSPRPPSASHARPASHFGFSSGPSVGSEPTHMRTSSAQACGGLPSSPARRTPSVIGGRPLPSTSHRFSSSPLPQPGPSAEQEKAQMAAYFAAKDAAEETARRRASVLPQYEASSSGHVDASSHPWSRPVSDWGRETTAAVYSSLVNNGTGETSGNANGSSGGLDGNKRFSARRSLDSVSTEDLPHHDPSISAGKQRAPLSPNGSIRPSTLSFSAGAGGLPFGLPGANTNTTAAAPAPAAQRVSPNGSTFSTSKVLAAPPKPIPAHDPSLWRPRYDWAERDMGLGEEEELASFEEHGPPAPKGSPPARPPKIPLA